MTQARNPVDRDRLWEVASKFGTDKARVHGYHRFYPVFLSSLSQYSEFTILEIGYGSGQSIPMWKSLFPGCHVACFDRDVSDSGDGYTVFQVDQGDLDAMADAIKKVPGDVRLIVDDGSHYPQHQLSSFSLLFSDLLKAGGCYFVEDVETSYWLAGDLYGNSFRYGLFSRWSTIEVFKLVADYANRAFIDISDRSLLEYSLMLAGLSPETAAMVGIVGFGQNCILTTKILPEDKDFAERDYGHSRYSARSRDSSAT